MKEYVFDAINFSVIASTVLIFFGILKSTPYVFSIAGYILKVIVGMFLVIRFSIFFNNKPLDYFEKKVCFVSGMYILVFTLGEYIHGILYGLRPKLLETGLIPTLK
jgi:predicted MPP superfamily phosphohydrolase